MKVRTLSVLFWWLWLLLQLPSDALARVKVFIMAGQSNMAGHGHSQHLIQLINSTGSPEWTRYWNYQTGNFSFRDDVFVNQNGVQNGNLTVGFGDVPTPGEMFFGPEVGFGGVMGDFYDEPVLLIKSAWGGLSLAVDFRPPSSGNEGWQWDAMLDLIHGTLGKLGQYVPNYAKQGYDIVGFVWFQGEADAYTPSRLAEYQSNLINFIHDVRYHLSSPNLPFIIGEMGGEGAYPEGEEIQMRQIQQNVVNLVLNTRYAPTAFLVNYNVSEVFDADYHYYGRADVYIRIGRTFARNMLVLLGLAPEATVSPTVLQLLTPSPSISPTKQPILIAPTFAPTTPIKQPILLPTFAPVAVATPPPTKQPILLPTFAPVTATKTAKPIPAPTLVPITATNAVTSCKDTRKAFYNKLVKTNTTCAWLKNRPARQIKTLCAKNQPAYITCRATCGACPITSRSSMLPTLAPCLDGPGEFQAISTPQTCQWLSQQPAQTIQDLCTPGAAARNLCNKTCNNCAR